MKYKWYRAEGKLIRPWISSTIDFGFWIGAKNEKQARQRIERNYFRLTVPPNIWFGFKGISRNVSIILNIADMIHDPDEVLRKNLDEIDVAWTIKNKDNITGHIN